MNFQEHAKPENLLKYSFIWSEIRLIIASVALFLGGIPPLIRLNPFSGLYEILGTLLTLCWIISGITSGYLIYRWNIGGRILFGRKNTIDTVTFFVMIVSGFNLGIAGLFKTNIGMSISSNDVLFVAVGLLYLFSVWHLFKEWKRFNKKLF